MSGIRWITLIRLTIDDMLFWSGSHRSRQVLSAERAMYRFASSAGISTRQLKRIADGRDGVVPGSDLEFRLVVSASIYTPEMVCQECRIPDSLMHRAMQVSLDGPTSSRVAA